ncbi:uncharacterized protein LOC125384450 [Haliotis rufescens]|uniref:uncharacterized protein LOC125384450 n=1 Tax=Haliotis rufescens TaxID=6454 RepID=UPI00201E77C3|nr:uncharacterized protein LOC125384450 [Haliotis rufescens]
MIIILLTVALMNLHTSGLLLCQRIKTKKCSEEGLGDPGTVRLVRLIISSEPLPLLHSARQRMELLPGSAAYSHTHPELFGECEDSPTLQPSALHRPADFIQVKDSPGLLILSKYCT